MKPRLASWETIKREYPDRFVLLENPVFAPTLHLKEAILLHKHKDQMKAIKKYLPILSPYRDKIKVRNMNVYYIQNAF